MTKWENKYKPKYIKEVIGHKKEIIEIKKWIVDFINEVPKCKKVLLITGNTGIGKSVIANSILNTYGYLPKEHLCFDIKGKNKIHTIIKQSLEYNNILDCFNQNRKPIGLILDQINILTDGGSNKNGFTDFINILKQDIDNIKKNKNISDYIYIYNPIICICEKIDSKIKKLLKYAKHIHLHNFDINDLKLKIKKIITNENININNNALDVLINYSNFDYRRFINLFEELHNSNKNKKITINLINKFKKIQSKKNKKYLLNDSVNDILTKKMDIVEATEIFYNNSYILPYYLYDNYLLYVNNFKIKQNKKIEIYSDLIENCCDYEYCFNQLDNNYDTNFVFYSNYCSTIPNVLCSDFEINKNIINKIVFPKLYTHNASKFINLKYNNMDFYNIYIYNLINYHLFNEKGNNKKLIKFIKDNNLNDINKINKIIKYKKMILSFNSNNNLITNNLKKLLLSI